jgi:hypothetical protein
MVIKALIDTKADASSIIDASVQFKNITGLPSILAVKPRSYTYGAPDSASILLAEPPLFNSINITSLM